MLYVISNTPGMTRKTPFPCIKYRMQLRAKRVLPCGNCPTCSQVPIRARSDFPNVAAGGHVVWPGLEPHRIMIDKIIFEFCVMVLILYSDYIDIKMPKAKSTWRVRKHRIVGEISYIRNIDQVKLFH